MARPVSGSSPAPAPRNPTKDAIDPRLDRTRGSPALGPRFSAGHARDRRSSAWHTQCTVVGCAHARSTPQPEEAAIARYTSLRSMAPPLEQPTSIVHLHANRRV